MKLQSIVLLLLLCCCESKRTSQASTDSTQPVAVKHKSMSHTQRLAYLSDTITVTTPQNYYNRKYALTMQEFMEDQEKALHLYTTKKPFSPSEHKAYQIVLTLDGKPILKKRITRETFKEGLSKVPLEAYYLDRVDYVGVRVNKLYFFTYLRRRTRPAAANSDSLKKYFFVEFTIDYLERIGNLEYSIYK